MRNYTIPIHHARYNLLTEGHEVPIGLSVEGATQHDMRLAYETIVVLSYGIMCLYPFELLQVEQVGRLNMISLTLI
jgi:hypothetical protein